MFFVFFWLSSSPFCRHGPSLRSELETDGVWQQIANVSVNRMSLSGVSIGSHPQILGFGGNSSLSSHPDTASSSRSSVSLPGALGLSSLESQIPSGLRKYRNIFLSF